MKKLLTKMITVTSLFNNYVMEMLQLAAICLTYISMSHYIYSRYYPITLSRFTVGIKAGATSHSKRIAYAPHFEVQQDSR